MWWRRRRRALHSWLRGFQQFPPPLIREWVMSVVTDRSPLSLLIRASLLILPFFLPLLISRISFSTVSVPTPFPWFLSSAFYPLLVVHHCEAQLIYVWESGGKGVTHLGRPVPAEWLRLCAGQHLRLHRRAWRLTPCSWCQVLGVQIILMRW
jgi:hypothetical protein